MNKLTSATVVILIEMFCVSGRAEAAAYPMVCRGGGTYVTWLTLNGAQASVTFSFDRAPHSATERQPGPGQCAWLDRPVNQKEPTTLVYETSVRTVGIEIRTDRIGTIGGTTNRLWSGLIDPIREGRVFYVDAENDEGRRFIVRRLGP